MRSRELSFSFVVATAFLIVVAAGGDLRADQHWEKPDEGFGQPISEEDLELWDIAIETPTGDNLPPGEGTVADGEEVYAERCQSCHGPEAQGGEDYMYGTMVGGIGTMTENPRVLTPGSMYPHAPILFDYVRRAMPLDNPHSLTPDQVYAVSAYIYHLNGLIDEDYVMNAETITAIEMPNRDAFIEDDRPDTANERCMEDCDPIGTVADADAAEGSDTEAGDEPDAGDAVEGEEVGGGGTGGQVEMGTEEDEENGEDGGN